jgi:hypothetical protein
MKFFKKCKDGGPQSPVDAYFLCEIKGLFSIALLKFNKGARESYHTHAFNACTWFLAGSMREETFGSSLCYVYTKSLIPKITKKIKNHRVVADEDSLAFTIRGPWSNIWTETTEAGKTTVLTHGRRVVRND